MTSKRRDEHSTEFGLWLREQPEIDSALGYIATNIDYHWMNYKTGQWLLIEEKRHRRLPGWVQVEQYKIMDAAARSDAQYHGFHVLVFENTSPDDGEIWLDGRYISTADLFDFLGFSKPKSWYTSYYPGRGHTMIAYAPGKGCER